MLNMYLQNLNKSKVSSLAGSIWENQLELKQNWLDKSNPAYMQLKKEQHNIPGPMKH